MPSRARITRPLTSFAAALAGLTLLLAQAAMAQEAPPSPPGHQEDLAVLTLEEVGTTGFHGMALLRAVGDETQAVVAIMPPDGLLPFVPPTEDDIGDALVLQGSCLEPLEIEHVIGRPVPVGPALDDGRTVHAVVATLPVPLSDLLTGEYVVAVRQEVDEEAPALPVTPVPEVTPPPPQPTPVAPPLEGVGPEMVLLACGSLLMPVPSPGPEPGPDPTPAAAPPSPLEG